MSMIVLIDEVELIAVDRGRTHCGVVLIIIITTIIIISIIIYFNDH